MTNALIINGVTINHDYFTQFSLTEKKEISEVEYKIKKQKIGSFYLFLLADNDFTTIDQLLNNQIPFYQEVNHKKELDNTLSNIIAKSALNGEMNAKAIEHIIAIKEEKFMFIRDLFIEKISAELYQGENDPDLKYSRYFEKILVITQQIMLAHPHYLPLLDNMVLDEIKEIKRIVLHQHLDLYLTTNSSQESKLKL